MSPNNRVRAVRAQGRFLLFLLLSFVALSVADVQAQVRSPTYPEADRAFMQLTLDNRVRLQILLTAAGYWQAVPNENFSGRIFDAIARFQSENGFVPNGIIDTAQFGRLIASGAPLLNQWVFRKVRHPTQDGYIWIPTGLGLVAEQIPTGLKYSDPRGRLSMTFDYFESFDLHRSFEALATDLIGKGSKILYSKVYQNDFFVVSASNDKTDVYVRYHQTWEGGLGFSLYWDHNAIDMHVERIATLISASLWSSMSGAPTTDPFVVSANNELISSAQSPVPITNSALTSPPPAAPAPPPASASNAPSASSPASPKPPDTGGGTLGTGFYIDREGLVLTNAHVVNGCAQILVATEKGTFAPAQLIARDQTNDLAVLRTNNSPSRIAHLRSSIRLGENVEAFGYPLAGVLATSGNFTLGNVSALAGLRDDSRYLQISAPVQPGNSGGPLLDQSGNLVGVVSAKMDALKMMIATNGDIPENINFAIKSSTAATFLQTNNIKYESAEASQLLQPADIADQAKSMSVFIDCQKP
jgi:serine protease Do